MKKLLFSLISIFSFVTLVGSQRGLYDRIFEEQKKRDFEDSLFFQTEDPFALSNYFLYGNSSERFKRLYQFPLSDVRKFLKEEQQKRIDALDAYLDLQMKDNLRIIKEYEDKNKNDLGQTDLDELSTSENGDMSEEDNGMPEEVSIQSPLQSDDSSGDSVDILGTDYQENDLLTAVKGRSRVSRKPYNIVEAEPQKKKKLNKQEKKEAFVSAALKQLNKRYNGLFSKDIIDFIYDNTFGLKKYFDITRNKTFYIDYIKLFGDNTEQLVRSMGVSYSVKDIKKLFTNYLELHPLEIYLKESLSKK